MTSTDYTNLPSDPSDFLRFDIETNGLLDVDDPRIHVIVINGTPYTGDDIEEAVGLLNAPEVWIAGHNVIKFDIPFIQRLYPWFKPANVFDTLVASRLIYTMLAEMDARFRHKEPDFPSKLVGSHSLKAWGWRLGVHKGDYGDTEGAWEALTPEMVDYCIQDVEVTTALLQRILDKDYSREAYQIEHDFAWIMAAQERFGFPFDSKGAGDLYATLCRRRAELQTKLTEVFPGWTHEMKKPAYVVLEVDGKHYGKFATKGEGEKARKAAKIPPKRCEYVNGPLKTKHTPFNPGSRDHIYKALHERYQWEPTEYTENGKPKVDEKVLEALDYPEAKLLSEFFLVQKRIGQVAEGDNAWLKLVKADGRIHGGVVTNGAVTGRCTHSHPNAAQVPGNRSPYGEACRSLWGPPGGMVQVGADASGLELRCFAHFLARWDGGAYTDLVLNGDIHTYNQQAAGLPTRDNAKTFIYGTLYGAGSAKIGSIVGKGAAAGSRLKKAFEANVPAYKKLVDTVQKAAGRGYLFGLDKRKLHVRSEHAALNTLLQSAGALIMKKACIFAWETLNQEMTYEQDFAFMANVHDEIQACARPDKAQRVGEVLVESMRAAGEFFGFKCPIDGEYKVGSNWSECH